MWLACSPRIGGGFMRDKQIKNSLSRLAKFASKDKNIQKFSVPC